MDLAAGAHLPSSCTAGTPRPARVRVRTGSRLHFGMLSFGNRDQRQFGGAGVMIDEPGLEIHFRPDKTLAVAGFWSDRVGQFAARLFGATWYGGPSAGSIDVVSAPQAHMGLGTGTQLALAVAAGLCRLWRVPTPTIEQLSIDLGRGRRSAIGTHGFRHGGLLVDGGKLSAENISPLVARVALPESWRWLLLCPQTATGLFGEAEEEAFERVAPAPLAVSDRLAAEILMEMVPAALEGDLERFSASLGRYAKRAGSLFSDVQGGNYAASSKVVVRGLADLGITNIVQSSWGPALATIWSDEVQARLAVESLISCSWFSGWQASVIKTANAGAEIIDD